MHSILSPCIIIIACIALSFYCKCLVLNIVLLICCYRLGTHLTTSSFCKQFSGQIRRCERNLCSLYYIIFLVEPEPFLCSSPYSLSPCYITPDYLFLLQTILRTDPQVWEKPLQFIQFFYLNLNHFFVAPLIVCVLVISVVTVFVLNSICTLSWQCLLTVTIFILICRALLILH